MLTQSNWKCCRQAIHKPQKWWLAYVVICQDLQLEIQQVAEKRLKFQQFLEL